MVLKGHEAGSDSQEGMFITFYLLVYLTQTVHIDKHCYKCARVSQEAIFLCSLCLVNGVTVCHFGLSEHTVGIPRVLPGSLRPD